MTMEDKFGAFSFDELNVLESALDFRKREMDVRDSRYVTVDSMLKVVRNQMRIKLID